MNEIVKICWGIDVSKEWLDINTGKQAVRINQTETAIKKFIKKHKTNQSILAVLESTGGYERLIVKHLSEANIIVHISHPNKVKAYAKAKGRLAKTDKIDANLLRDYGFFIREDEIKPLPTASELELEILGARLEQLKEMHHQESCRKGITSGLAKESIILILEVFESQIERIKIEIRALIDANPELKEKYDILCSMKGVGPTLAMKLITDLPELGKANKKEIAALIGVAPITHESGKKKEKAITRYGRFGVRKVLYMGALVASHHNPSFKTFYKKLIAKGKAPKVALVAVMRKMIVVLNAMIQSKKHFYA